ncbi:hypothetical protein GUJ93_ZPchr0008g12247 [Zizania palustris]|uniref:ATP-dependent RNA helicase n=1 Tax=Zizania palustris TaxID=103762 RepID=A0A8J5RGU6_ZIZPA|nr:hypothetical protein GUJ93_ZPchr0008g12247 [Zizania palustris]
MEKGPYAPAQPHYPGDGRRRLRRRTHVGLSVLLRASPCRRLLRVPARRRGGAPPLTAAKVDIADVVGSVRSSDAADPKRRRSRNAEEGLAFSKGGTSRGRGSVVHEEDVVGGEAMEFEAAKNGGEAGGVDGSYLSETRFDQCAISPLSLKAIKDAGIAGYERMTQVQEATLPIILQGKDVLAKAKTGIGKTVAFLLPAIEALSTLPNSRRNQLRSSINFLVMCPTRELANQVAVEAKKLLNMQANPCQILVATPGRLKDHLETTLGFSTRLKERQTLLFSATVPEEVCQISHIAMKKDYKFINTIKDGDEETHSQVSQMFMAAVHSVDANTQTKVKDAVRKVEMRSKESAYQAWLGYYNSNKTISREKSRLVKLAEEFSQSMGLAVPPAIPKQILRKVGLNNVPGLRST